MNQQGTDAWRQDRCGYATASRFRDILATIKNGEAAVRRNYRYQLVVERLTGAPAGPAYENDAMRWGKENEPLARAAAELTLGVDILQVGFVRHVFDHMVGCSPDGLIGDDAGFEAKCPYESAVHLQTVERGEMPAEHIPQVQGSMWITERKRWLFVSFDPRLPSGLRLFHQWVERDEKYIAMLADEVEKFLVDVDVSVNKLRSLAA